MTDSSPAATRLLEQVTAVVAAYVAHNRVPVAELPALVTLVHRELGAAPAPQQAGPVATTSQAPAVAVKKSVRPGHIVCLECAKPMSMLKRHLRSHHGLTPDEYRVKWNLPADYPIVAPDYAAERSRQAFARGFGRRPATDGT